jgi:hypothetical protein
MNSANPSSGASMNSNMNTTGNNNNNQNIYHLQTSQFFLLSPLINNSQITANNVCVGGVGEQK